MTKIYVTGDIHGYAPKIPYLISDCTDAAATDYLIVCGDFGSEYGGMNNLAMKKALTEFPGKIIVLRGNHDDRYWNNHIYVEQYNNYRAETPHDGWAFVSEESWEPHFLYEKEYPNIWYTRDEGDIIYLGGYNFLFVPGAYSVDKESRLNNHWAYNPHEQLTYIEMSRLLDKIERFTQNHDIDFVISHTLPFSWEYAYQWLFINGINQSKVDKSTEKFLDNIEKILHNNYIHWFGGHFHYNMVINEKATMLFDKVIEIGEYCCER